MQYLIPGGYYINETGNNDYQIYGNYYVDETAITKVSSYVMG